MTGIANKAGRMGCVICGDPSHWKDTCPHRDKEREQAKPQLIEVGNEETRGGN